MDPIVLHKAQDLRILRTQHLMDRHGTIPLRAAKVNNKRNDRDQFVFFPETGKELSASQPDRCLRFTVGFGLTMGFCPVMGISPVRLSGF